MYKVFVDEELFCDSRINELAIINPVVKLEVNSAGSFTFTVPPEHPKKDKIKRRTSIIKVVIDDASEPVFQGIAVEENTDFYNQKAYTCEGELSYLNDSIQRQAHYTGLTVRQLLETYINSHNSQVEAAKRFTIGQVTVTDPNDYITCYTNMNSTMKEIKEDLVDDLGGYLRIRYADGVKYIDYLAESPHTSSQVIKLGQNLLDYSSNIDNTEIATSIIPLGAKLEEQTVEGLDARLDIKTVNDDKDYVYSEDAVTNYGWITQVVTWDDVTTASALKSKGEKYLADIQFENVVLEIKAVDFGLINEDDEQFKLLDQIRVVSAPHGMDRYFMLTEQTLNLNNPENDTIVLGSEESLSLSAQSNAANAKILEQIEQVPTSSFMQSAINNATALITGNEGGYVKIKNGSDGKPSEILIMDTESEDTATKIWRWNTNGLGYSSDGGKTYSLAMTADGAIVADFITSGTMSMNRIKGGAITADSDVTIAWSAIDGADDEVTEISKDTIKTATISCSQISGDTLKLGGASNANGLMEVYDSDNVKQGTWDKDGILLGDYFKVDENGLYSRNGEQSFSVFPTTFYVYSNGKIKNGTEFDKIYIYDYDGGTTAKFKCTKGTLRVFFTNVTYDTSATYYISIYGTQGTAISASFGLGKGCYKFYDNFSSDDYGYGDFELNPNTWYFDLDLSQQASVLTTPYGYITKISVSCTNASDNIEICGVEIIDYDYALYSSGSWHDMGISATEYSKNLVKTYADNILINTADASITLSDLYMSKDLIQIRDDAHIIGFKTTFDSAGEPTSTSKNLDISPSKILHLGVYGNTSSDGSTLKIQSDGTFSRYVSSSKRYKHDITTEISDELNPHKLYDLQISQYKYNEDYLPATDKFYNKDVIGLIAEDVNEVYPIATTYDEAGQVEMWEVNMIVPAMLKLIQEQNDRITALEEKIGGND